MSKVITPEAKLVHDYLEGMNVWDFDAMKRVLHPEISYELPYAFEPFLPVYKGIDDWFALVSQMPDFVDPPNLHDIEVEALASDPNELVAEFKSDTHIKQSGREYRNEYLVRVTVRDGRIFRFVERFNQVCLAEAMGGSLSIPTYNIT